jgi:hypothetical protein
MSCNKASIGGEIMNHKFDFFLLIYCLHTTKRDLPVLNSFKKGKAIIAHLWRH